MEKVKTYSNSIFIRLFVTFILVIIPIIIIGANIYNWGVKSIRDEITESMRIQNVFCLDELENEIYRIRGMQYNILFDDDLTELAVLGNMMEIYDRDRALLRVNEKINTMKESSRYINEISIYLTSIKKIITVTSILDMKEDSVDNVIKYGENNSSIYFVDEKIFLNAQRRIDTVNEYQAQTIFIEIEFDNTEIQNMINELKVYEGSEAFIYNYEKDLMFISDDKYYVNDSLREFLFNNILIAPINTVNDMVMERNEVLSFTINGEKNLLVNTESDYLNISIIRIIPEYIIFSKLNNYRIWFIVFSVVAIIVVFVFSISTYKFIHTPLCRLVKAFLSVENGNMDIKIEHQHRDEFRYIYSQFNSMVNNLRKLIDQVLRQKILVQKAELKQLQSQINPHFLYNSFFILHKRIKYGDIDNALVFSEQLGEYFKFITRSVNDEVVLSKEVEYARIYTKIQSTRFSNRIKVNFQELPSKYENILVPKLIIQPVIENAFEHGLEELLGEGILSVKFEGKESLLKIIIEDNGIKMADEELEKIKQSLDMKLTNVEVTGLVNIHKRLKLKFGDKSGMILSRSRFGGLRVELCFHFDESLEMG